MRADDLFPAIAAQAGVEIVGPLAGGVFGATLVRDAEGRELVLKAMASERWERIWARGASMANHLRASGYPAPEYVATGVAEGATWSLQERLRGDVPDVIVTPPADTGAADVVTPPADTGAPPDDGGADQGDQ